MIDIQPNRSQITAYRFFLAVVATLLLSACSGGGGSGAGGDTDDDPDNGSNDPVSGLDFPDNDDIVNGSTVRFQFTSPPDPYPATYIWKLYPRQQAGYYTTFFWGNNGSFDAGDIYYGFHPYPQPAPNGTDHKWEISVNGFDTLSSQDVEYNAWYTQVARVYISGSDRVLKFYWDWPNTSSRVITEVIPIADQPDPPPNPVLTFGDAPWAQGNEMLSGILRGIQVYDSLLSLSDIANELASPGSVQTPWYLNLNPTPDDISDKSGSGHNPVWVGSLRPTVYKE